MDGCGFQAVRRMGCPLCRKIVAEVLAAKDRFDQLGARVVVIAAQELGADKFAVEVWPGQELYIDDADTVRTALGGGNYSNWWLLKPSVLGKIMCGSLPKDGGFGDLNDKSNKLGGELVVRTLAARRGVCACTRQLSGAGTGGAWGGAVPAARGQGIRARVGGGPPRGLSSLGVARLLGACHC